MLDCHAGQGQGPLVGMSTNQAVRTQTSQIESLGGHPGQPPREVESVPGTMHREEGEQYEGKERVYTEGGQ
jgi:hypothetical protein